MRALIITFNIFIILFFHYSFVFAQHDNNASMDDSVKLLFRTQNSEFTAEVQSVSEKLVTKKLAVLYLKLSSAFLIDSSTVALNINSNNGKVQNFNKHMDYSLGFYKSNVLFEEPDSYKFTFSFDLKDSIGIFKKVNFSFTKEVKATDNMQNHDHGFMGMSNAMMIIMGAAMLAMMAIAIIVGTNHK
ncbi:MAG: hypothetical protein M3R36_00500 [Bacteroidota bacterium]|nr:hypothetical protein [Bacteroidota bacterium]